MGFMSEGKIGSADQSVDFSMANSLVGGEDVVGLKTSPELEWAREVEKGTGPEAGEPWEAETRVGRRSFSCFPCSWLLPGLDQPSCEPDLPLTQRGPSLLQTLPDCLPSLVHQCSSCLTFRLGVTSLCHLYQKCSLLSGVSIK